MNIIFALLGALVNRIRGGWATDFARSKNWISEKDKIPKVKLLNDIIYSTAFAVLLDFRDSWNDLFCVLILFGSMALGRAMGWGGYISAMIDKEIDHNRDDVKILDKWFRGNDEPILSGWAALSIRGFMWSSCIYLGFLAISFLGHDLPNSFHYIPLVGLFMGSSYLLAITVCDKLSFRGNGWQYGEMLFGGVLWGLIYYLV